MDGRIGRHGAAALLWMLIFCPVAAGQLRLPALFSDHMVVQRGSPLPVWGWAEADQAVTVRLGEHNLAHTKADADGRWQVKLKPVQVGAPMQLVVEADHTLTINDVVAGEVWICSGQSNMQWPVSRSNDAESEIAAADHPMIRLFTVAMTIAEKPSEQLGMPGHRHRTWKVCRPETIPSFSAVGYYFARHLHNRLNVPVGMINSSWGGTLAEAWTRLEVLQDEPILRPIAERRSAVRVDENGHSIDDSKNPHRAAVLYNAMIAPLIPYRIKGAIWYQGESNVSRAWQYRTLFPTMIGNWREDWGQGDFPFYFTQLAPFNYGNTDPRCLAELWEAQFKTLSLPNTGMAVTVDITDLDNIHPPNKQDVGKRLALWALARDYAHLIVYSGPLYHSQTIDDQRIRLHFKHTGGGLKTNNGAAPSHFQIAGRDRHFIDAEATIDGETVVLRADGINAPVAARYAWRQDALPNLTNLAGLPASPFRTDRWEMVTTGRK